MTTLYPFAKVNVHLEVGPLRHDGYHDLRSLSTKINLCDEMQVEITQGGYALMCQALPDLKKQDDLLFKAMQLFQSITQLSFGLRIHLKKVIPMQGGLGGGSSDAGMLLRFLNEYFDYPIEEARLVHESRHVGADVPFFVHSTHAAYIEGMGEKITPIDSKKIPMMLLFPSFGVNTGAAYRALDAQGANSWSTLNKDVLIRMWQQRVAQWQFFNSFSLKLKEEFPGFLHIEEFLALFDLDYYSLSGSGSTYVVMGKKEILESMIVQAEEKGYAYAYPIETQY